MTDEGATTPEPGPSSPVPPGWPSSIETLRGSITSIGFGSGDRFVIGWWPESPIGSFADIMWSDSDNQKRLVAHPDAAAYVNDIYPFEQHVHHEVRVRIDEASARSGQPVMIVDAGPIALSLKLSRLVVPFPPRPRQVTATVERHLAYRLLGVNTYGVSPTGVEEWYRTRSLRRIIDGRGAIDGAGLGPIGPVARPLGFGFSDPPELPLHVRLRVDLRRP